MIHIMIPFKVRQDAVEFTENIIGDFLTSIKEKEPNTVLYRSLQQTNDPSRFTHIMTFEDEGAKSFHRKSEHCKNFIEQLYPLCEEAPEQIHCNAL